MSADEFNAKYAIGTPVVYQPILDGEGVLSVTRTEAWELGSGHTVVSIKGKAGGVSLEHCVVISEPPATRDGGNGE